MLTVELARFEFVEAKIEPLVASADYHYAIPVAHLYSHSPCGKKKFSPPDCYFPMPVA